MVYTIQDDVDTTTLPNIQNDGLKTGSGLQPIALPDSDASEAILIPILGPLTNLNVRGLATGSLSTLQTFTAKMIKWVEDGGKISKPNITYVTTLNGSFSARVINGDWSWDKGNPNTLPYFLEIVQGTFT